MENDKGKQPLKPQPRSMPSMVGDFGVAGDKTGRAADSVVLAGFTAAFLLTMLILCGLIFYTWLSYRGQRAAESGQLRIVEIGGQIAHLDEVLTMSARMAAATGENKWQERYRSFEPKLDDAINEAIDIASEYRIAIEQTQKANEELVSMELRAFELIKSGEQAMAMELLYSDEYEKNKALYSNGLQTVMDSIKNREDEKLKKYRFRSFATMTSLGATMPLVAFVWVIALRILKKYTATQKRAQLSARMSEQCFRAVADYTYAWEIWVSPTAKALWTNPEIERVSGYSIDEFMDMKDYLIPLVHAEDRKRVGRAVRSAIAGSTGKELEFRLDCKDGNVKWVNMSWQPIYDKMGNPQGHRASIRDISEKKQAQESLDFRYDFEKLVSEISSEFINLKSFEIDEGINKALETIAEFVGADRSYIFQYSDNVRTMSNTHEWSRQEVTSQIANLQNMDVDQLPWFRDRMNMGEPVLVRSVRDLPEEAKAEKEEWSRESIQSLLCVPMESEEKLVGFVGFDAVHAEYEWTEDVVNLLRLVGEIFANALGRKQAEEVVRQSEEQYRALVETMNEGLGVTDENDVFTYVNNKFCNMLGFAFDELVGNYLKDFVDQESFQVLEQQMSRLRLGEMEKFDITWKAKDGHKVYTIASPKGLFDPNGKFKGTFGVLTDITERRRSEAELRETQQRLQDFFENAPVGFHIFGPDRVITDMNDLELAMIGYQRDEIVGKKTWADLIIPEQNERFEQHWRDIKTKGKVKNIEYTLLAKDGRKIEVILNASSRFDDDGNLINTRGSVLDITERKRAREAIESIVAGTARETGEDYLRSLVRHLSSAMGCKYVFVGELEEQETDRIKTLSVWADGNFAENFVYDIAGTPCQNVVGKQLCFFPRDIQEKFPDDHLIKEMGVVSYVGTPLHDSSGRALGILVAMDDKPMRGEAFAESILKVFGMRAAAELERKEAEEILKLRERAIGEATNGIIISGYEGYENPVIYANPAFERITGYKLEEIKGLDCRFLQSKDRDQKELDEVRAAIADGRSCQTVVKNYRKDGSLFWNELSISPVRDEFGEVTHYVGIINDITDRKQAEDAIGRLAKFPDENPNPVLRTMSDGSIVYCNRAGEPLLKEWECDLGDKLTGKCLQCVTDAMKTNKLVWLEFDCGDQIYLLSFAPVSGLDYLNIYGFNITVRKRAELELKESEEKYRLLFETNPHPMWVYDLDNLSFLAVNDTAVRTYGHSREEFLNMTIKDIRPQEDIPALLKSLENLKGGVDFGGVWRHKKKDGTIFFVETIAHTITFEGRHAEIVLASDVTERKRVEDSLAAERNLLRTLIDNIPDSIYVKDAESRFVMCNMAAACFMGKSDTEQVIGKTDFDFYQKELAEEYLSDEHQVLDTGLAVVNKDEPRIGAQNKMVWVLTTKVPLKDRDGRVIGLIGISRNITDRKQAEDARDRLNRELALKNKELESILYVASHDLRSPLVNIQGFSHELRRSCDVVRDGLSGVKGKTGQAAFEEVDKKIPEALNFILTSAQKMDSLIAGLLRLSRLGRAAMKPEVLDMNKMMGDIAASMEFQLKDAGVNVQIDSLPACVGDASQINQVFSNLLDNSIKYLDKARPGIIHIYGEIEGDRTIYCVEDNGVGVAHDYQDKIFEIFHRLVPGVKSGEGLGLTIVKRVLDRHGGNVWVESEQGKGSKFFVSLPNRLR